jgi:hypothetical protein
MSKYQGSCACGAVKFSTDADPMMAGHCQCGKCQKLSGTGHQSFAAFPESGVKVSGKTASWSYKADSGNTATRQHCSSCGSPMFGGSTGMPGMLAVNLSMLDDSSGINPAMLFFTAKQQAWDHMDPGLARFPGMPPM